MSKADSWGREVFSRSTFGAPASAPPEAASRVADVGTVTFGRHHGADDAFELVGALPALLTPAEQSAVTARLQARSHQRGQSLTSLFLLSGLLFCGVCGFRMSGHQHGQRATIRFYRCQHTINGHERCVYNYQNAKKLEAAVLDQVAAHGASIMVDSPTAIAVPDVTAERAGIERERAKVDADLLKAFQAYTSGAIADEAQYALVNRELQARQAALSCRLADLALREAAAQDAEAAPPAAPRSFLDELASLSIQERKAALARVVQRVTCLPDKRVEVTWQQ